MPVLPAGRHSLRKTTFLFSSGGVAAAAAAIVENPRGYTDIADPKAKTVGLDCLKRAPGGIDEDEGGADGEGSGVDDTAGGERAAAPVKRATAGVA